MGMGIKMPKIEKKNIENQDEEKKEPSLNELDDMINKLNNEDGTDLPPEGEEQEGEKKVKFDVNTLIEIEASLIQKTYDDIDEHEEGEKKAETFTQIMSIVFTVIPFEEGLNDLGTVEMKPRTALIIGSLSMVLTGVILTLPAMRKKKVLKQLEKEAKEREEQKNTDNGAVVK